MAKIMQRNGKCKQNLHFYLSHFVADDLWFLNDGCLKIKKEIRTSRKIRFGNENNLIVKRTEEEARKDNRF
jgi:hypothetical protein